MNSVRDDFMPNMSSTLSAYGGIPHVNGTESITKMLSDFGLGEKEAQLYVHLLKYGPKRAGDLAWSLKTYRLEVYRKLARLVNKNMVNVKKESPAVYSAVDLNKALNDVMLDRQRELNWVGKAKTELLERVNGTRLSLKDDPLLLETISIEDDPAFIQLLTAFGLNKKDSQLYAHLLKYGPKRAGDLARSLKTYREDVYRRCARLIDIGVVSKTSENSSPYVPVELDVALNKAVTAHKRDLRRLQRLKRRLMEGPSITPWQGENAYSSFKLVKSVGEVITVISQLINSAEVSIILVAHPRFNLISMGGFQDHLRCAVTRGVSVRGVLDIYPRKSLAAREYLSCGVELRHKEYYRGMTMMVADGKQSISLIYADLKTALSLDENVAALSSDNISQAEFLTSAFEMTWKQAVNAKEFIDQQLQQEPHNEPLVEQPNKTLSIVGYTAARQPSFTRS